MINEFFAPKDVQALKVRYDLIPYTRGIVLDLGCGPWKTFPHFIGVDLRENWPSHIPWGPDVNLDCRHLSIFAGQSVDAVFSSYLLNELEDQKAALKEWWRVVKPGGYLVLYLPWKEMYENDIAQWMDEIGGAGWNLLVREARPADNAFLQVYQKRSDDRRIYACATKKPDKTCAVVRLGGVGDMVQTSSIFPELRKQGYFVTLYTSEGGYEIVKHDPNIDHFVVQQHEQVPNRELGEYWAYLAKKYDKFVNLSESVEGTLLALSGRMVHKWPHGARDMILNHNYLEVMHAIAEVPFVNHTKFYANLKEIEWAERQKRNFSFGGKCVVWTLSGSSVHKAWPYLDQVMARLLIMDKEARIVLAGDDLSQLLEAGWEAEPRVLRTSGKWSIRQTLAFTCHAADLVVGPETGVMNAVSMLPVPKIITLSHSSVENLTRDWVNTASLTPEGCACWPCHSMHDGFTRCSRDATTGVAECQAKISPEAMAHAIDAAMRERRVVNG